MQKFRLKDPEGHVTDAKIPTLKEVILWSKGKTMVNLDKKDLPLEMTAKILTECKKAFKEYEAAGVPWPNMIAYIGPENKPENKELFDMLHAKGVMGMISAAPTYDKLRDAAARAKNYIETFEQGADILESDLPIEVAAAIKPMMIKEKQK